MPMVCILFSYTKACNLNLLFTVCFCDCVPFPHQFQFMVSPAEFCFCCLLLVYSFLIILTLISVVSPLELYCLIGLNMGPQVLWSSLLILTLLLSCLHKDENAGKHQTLESRVLTFPSLYCCSGPTSLYQAFRKSTS